MGSVLITGCSSGIGLATAVLFAQEGEKVFAGVRTPATATALHEAIAAESLDVTVVALDVRDQASVDAAVALVER